MVNVSSIIDEPHDRIEKRIQGIQAMMHPALMSLADSRRQRVHANFRDTPIASARSIVRRCTKQAEGLSANPMADRAWIL